MSLSVMLVAPGGQGKSHVSATSPGPILYADLEGAAHKLPRPFVYWSADDITAGKFPTGLTPESIVVAVPENFPEFARLVGALHSPTSPFVSFWIDSMSVLTQLGEVEIARKKANTQQGFGELLNFLRPALTGLKQLTVRPESKLEVLGVTAWQRDDKPAPSLQGAIGTYLNQTFDVCGYVKIGVHNGKLANWMQIMGSPNATDPKAKGTGPMYLKYGEEPILNPNFTELNAMHNQETK